MGETVFDPGATGFLANQQSRECAGVLLDEAALECRVPERFRLPVHGDSKE